MICLGASIRDHSGRAIAGIAVSLIPGEANAPLRQKLGADLRTVAQILTRRLGTSRRGSRT
ncbi:hypothetical protein NS365_02355 [Aureimonas ureilytica]|uniref:IclR-ED domain-containing protein n=1 Tax=Aureimonas ureilytica TaxID=401562 RepID=A0A175RVH7_9HYPH|nr:hypothetical protein NS365_02355 [Aureimonas ureilytica]